MVTNDHAIEQADQSRQSTLRWPFSRLRTESIVGAIRSPGEGSGDGPAAIDLRGGVVRTDASTKPVGSGGLLFNAACEVIGVNTAIVAQTGGQ
jgi:S1-C subfamily serine protease